MAPRSDQNRLDIIRSVKERAERDSKSVIVNIYRRHGVTTEWVAQAVYPPHEPIPPLCDSYIISAECDDCDRLYEELTEMSFSVRKRVRPG